jgi:hypothetical protein
VAIIFLMPAFKLEEVIIPTTLLGGELAADCRAGLINRAAPFFRVKELTDATKVLIFLAPHDAFVTMVGTCEFLLHRIKGRTEVLGEPLNIFFSQNDHWIGTAIAGTFEAIITGHETLVVSSEGYAGPANNAEASFRWTISIAPFK